MDGSTRRFDTFTIAEFDAYDHARPLEQELESLQRDVGLDAAMSLAEEMATANRYLNPFRADPRVFFEEDAPADPFTTDRQREQSPGVTATEPLPTLTPWYLDPVVQDQIAQEEMAHAALEGEAWFQATFPDDGAALLQPLDETVNYGLVIQAADPHTSELAVEKYWREDDGRLGYDALTLHTFETDDDVSREQAEAERDRLLTSYTERGLTGLMGQAELLAMEHGWLQAGRLDPRLFTQRPLDRFETLAEWLRNEPNPYHYPDRDVEPDTATEPPTPQAGSWDELIARETEKPLEELPRTPFDRLWHLYDRPVETPGGELKGHALHLVYYPDVHQDAFADGDFSDVDYPEGAMSLGIKRVETSAQAQRFASDFAGYIRPGLLDPPELAEEVARLEGLPVEWSHSTSGLSRITW